ncbi:MAG: YdcF family protein [Terracidiphilus sp.]|nr:YdcF family protein [Terracidiphilus sp.]MDR3777036.1 YdcF family protein [Terracidiphilus sp.]
MPQSTELLARDINRISAYLALDDFMGNGPGPRILSSLDAIVLLGNQVVETLTTACTLLDQARAAILLFSGGAGHSTPLLYENLRTSRYSELVQQGLIQKTMAEAEMYAMVARVAFAIPAGSIRIENRSRNSAENASYSLEILQDRGLEGPVLLLQDPTMLRRSILTWTREVDIAGSDARTLSHAVFVPKVEPGPDGALRLVENQAQGTWTLERFLGLILGEIERLNDDENGYGPMGKDFLPHVDIPEAIYESYRRVSEHFNQSMALQAVR